ncbi:MAG: ribonuclease P protein component [Pseudoxanthomonas sp.]|nr:ribonuclease P protein component [Pseudoxanthomonas sp.]
MTAGAATLPRAARLSGKAQFDRVFAAGHRRGSRYFRLVVADNGLDHPRLGMAVSRRIDRRAVVRNRLRRQVREAFRLHWRDLPAIDVVVTARPEAAHAPRAEVWADLLALWKAQVR